MVLQCRNVALSGAMATPDDTAAPGPATAAGKTAIMTPLPDPAHPPTTVVPAAPAREIGGPAGPEPTRFGDWEKAGRCIDF
jgi:hypothetical protein